MHFERCRVNQQARTDELGFFVVLAQDVTYILTKETLDTLAKLLHALDVCLLHAPGSIREVGRTWPEWLDSHLGTEVPGDIGDQVADDRKGVHGLEDDR